MKARLNPIKRLRWWWITRTYELNAEKTTTFWEWLNANDLALCAWELVEDGDQHTHDLVQLEMESTEAVLSRYLKHMKAGYCASCDGDHQCGACGGQNPDCSWCSKKGGGQ